jgi:formate dehydrogenase subunit gamma
MAVTIPPRRDARAASATEPLMRFDLVERWVHWINALLFLVLVFTGAALYIEPLASVIGRRALVENIHVYCGIALPVPLAAALAGRWGRALREDLKRFNRWSDDDRLWLGTLMRGGRGRIRQLAKLRIGKFNPGQKLNAAFVAGAGLVMLATGVVMRWYHPYPLSWRTGATFVHDWLAVALGIVIVGHIGMALRDPDAMRSMVKGHISAGWAARHAPAWLSGEDPPAPRDPS